MSDAPKQPPVSLSDDCTAALRDVAYGEKLIASKATPEAALPPLMVTQIAIDNALKACKSQTPEQGLNRKKHEIDERIKHTEDQLLQPLPKLPTDHKIGRASANIS